MAFTYEELHKKTVDELRAIASDVKHAALISTLAFMMALLVAQSRVEAGIHSAVEVVAGAALGTGVTILMFQLLG